MKKILVYQSKNEKDYQKAQELLNGAGILHHDWETEEVSQCGCGGKVDVRKFGRKGPIPTKIFHIETDKAAAEEAERVLKGKVLPVLYYGFGI
ncbi:MAG: hypothetical protein U0L49_08805 [Eubacterium sp.]|nr:hypothetical protein [Eubacterium sp.]